MIAAVASATPSMMPTVTMDAPRVVTMKTGSRLWISSEETSMNSEPKPSAQMPAGRARQVATDDLSRSGGRRRGAGPWGGGISSNSRAEQGPDSGGERHGERAPESHPRDGLPTGEPPARAARAPNSARKNKELPDTVQTRAFAAPRGPAAAAARHRPRRSPAEAKAACTGRALSVSEMPSSSRAWAPSASLPSIGWRLAPPAPGRVPAPT